MGSGRKSKARLKVFRQRVTASGKKESTHPLLG